ncbi:MAG: GHKL domain-containing protein [Sporomusaceae bacterium]|jgi:signal transduction histidine kinase|nr:GHKL domain-containing protein [Sporomusaceae bacterium]
MKPIFEQLKIIKRETIIFLISALLCASFLIAFGCYYFNSYQNPYILAQVIDLSANWQYQTAGSQLMPLDDLKTGPQLLPGETMTLFKTLDVSLPQGALLIRANHQTVNVYLNEQALFLENYQPGQNPGMALHFILLPDDYLHKTLKIEITSPYALYAGRTSSIFLGTIPSLGAYAVSSSMRSFILMAICLFLGCCTIALTVLQALKGFTDKQNLALGVFAVVWAVYYVCTDYISFLFFTPSQMSLLSLGSYFVFQIPLTFFLYFSLEKYKKWLLPAVVLPLVFALTAFSLQFLQLVDLPRLVDINNLLLTGLIYAIVLSGLEAVKEKNRLLLVVVPFLLIAYLSMLYNFDVFYNRRGIVPYSYKDTYFLLILVVLVYNIQQFFRRYYRQRQERELLSLQIRLAEESYHNIKNHLQEVGSLKHEIRNHLAALETYLQDGRYEEAQAYLSQYARQTGTVAEAVFHDNFLLNAVVGNFMKTADKNGIKVKLNLQANPEHIAEPDLYSLLMNILENALEACASLSAPGEKFINLTISRRDPYLIIACENSKAGEIVSRDNNIQTQTPTGGHGYGLWTIGRIVDAYDGMMDIDYNENTFMITTAIKDK